MIKANRTKNETRATGHRDDGKRLLLKTREVCDLLGNLNPRTLARLEARGIIRSVKLLRHKLYAREDVETLVQSLRDWKLEVPND
jgi:hypothetical protein